MKKLNTVIDVQMIIQFTDKFSLKFTYWFNLIPEDRSVGIFGEDLELDEVTIAGTNVPVYIEGIIKEQEELAKEKAFERLDELKEKLSAEMEKYYDDLASDNLLDGWEGY